MNEQDAKDERWQAAKLLLVASHTARSVEPPSGSTLSLTVELWLDALNAAGVPTNRFRSLLAECLAEGGEYPIGVNTICRQWRRELAAMPAPPLPDTANGAAMKALPAAARPDSPGRRAFVLLGERLKGGRNVACECGRPAKISRDGFDWICVEGRCAFRWPVQDTANAPHSGTPGPLQMAIDGLPSTPKEEQSPTPTNLLAMLAERCGFQAEAVGEERALSFARHLAAVVPVAVWTQQVARNEWSRWQEAQTAQAATAQAQTAVMA